MNRLIPLCLCTSLLFGSAHAQLAQVADDAVTQQLRVATDDAAKGDIAAALAEIKGALAHDSNRSDLWYELGSVLGQAGDFQGAEAAFRHAIQLKPDQARLHFSLALTLIGNPQGKMDWAGAIAECREALKLQPDDAAALNLLGAGLSAAGQTAAAIPELRHAIQLSPALAEAHFNLALALENQGTTPENKTQLEEAVQEYRAAVAAKGAYPEATAALGNLLFHLGRTDEAVQELSKALRLNPDLTGAHYTLARILRTLNRKSAAAVEFAETKDLTDRLSNGIQSSQMSNQALELAAKGDSVGAQALLLKAIALKPDYGVPHYNLGLILADSGDSAGAQRELAKAISLLPGQAKPWFNLGRVRRLAKDNQGALDAVAWAARLSPSDAAIHAELVSLQAANPLLTPSLRQPVVGAASDTASDHLAFARQLKAQGDFMGEAGELLRSLALQPASLDVRRSLAEAYFRLNDTDHALLEYNKLLRSAPEDFDAHLALGRILASKGNYPDAVDQFRKALALQPDSVQARTALDEAEKVFSKP
jgi:tetratricopeptide (TPR) repeat protein